MKKLKDKAQKAISDGYKFCIQEGFEDALIHLTDIFANPDLFEGKKLLLCEKEPRKITISDDQICELIVDYLINQDEFYSEDFDESCNGCDDELKHLSDAINANLSKHNFYFPSNISL